MKLHREHLPWERKKDMFWVCPECGEINTYNYDYMIRAKKRLKREIFICYGSCYDNICGNCKSNIVECNSPILAEVYTHIPRE